MTEKVKVTREQAEAIEFILSNDGSEDSIKENLIRKHAKEPNRWCGKARPILGMPLLTLVDALRIGYDIEEEYKVGDWVVWETEHERYVLQIETINHRVMNRKVFNAEGFWMECIKRHATPEEIKAEKERRVWAKIGREPMQFIIGDSLISIDGRVYPFDKESRISEIRRMIANGRFKGFYPAESFIEFGGGEE